MGDDLISYCIGAVLILVVLAMGLGKLGICFMGLGACIGVPEIHV